MTTDIEYFDQKRMMYLKWYLICFTTSFVLLLTRHFFRLSGLNSQPIGIAVLVGAVIGVVGQAIFIIGLSLIKRDISRDPHLETALNNELVRTLYAQSWVAAYAATSITTLFFAISTSFYPICDAVSISLTSIMAGAGASQAYFYIRYKRS